MRLASLLTCLLAASAVLAFAPSVARATVLVEVPLDDMIFDADAIVLGEVVHVGTRVMVSGARTEPWTATTIRVERWLSGSGERRVVVEERGGEWQGGGLRIAGMPRYTVGERVLVFLWRDPAGRLRTYGMAQGKFVVRAGMGDVPTTVERDLDAVAFASWADGQMILSHHRSPVIQLEAMLLRIGQVLERVGTGVAPPDATAGGSRGGEVAP